MPKKSRRRMSPSRSNILALLIVIAVAAARRVVGILAEISSRTEGRRGADAVAARDAGAEAPAETASARNAVAAGKRQRRRTGAARKRNAAALPCRTRPAVSGGTAKLGAHR